MRTLMAILLVLVGGQFALAATAGPNSPALAVSDSSSGGSTTWSLINQVYTEGDGYSSATLGSDGGPLSFSSDTLISTPHGSKSISQLQMGDLVWSYNFETKNLEPKSVQNVYHHPISENSNLYYHVYYPGSDFKVTGNHEIFANGQWIRAENLKTGDVLVTRDQQLRAITQIKPEPAFNQDVWNLSIARNFNFYAGGVLVHNAGSLYDHRVRIVKGGVIGATDKASVTAWPGTLAYTTYGGEADLWGETWTVADINSTTFGVAISGYASGYTNQNSTSYYVKATNFGFSIPGGATINGIVAEVKKQNGGGVANIDHVRLTVYYTPNTTPTVSTLGPSTLTDGSTGNDPTPTLTFTTADTDANTVAYELTLDDSSDFSSPAYQATSTYATPGAISTTTASLPDGSYYWRVLVGDGNATSTYTTANDGAVAFVLDTAAPTPGTLSLSATTDQVIATLTGAADAGSGLAVLPYLFRNLTLNTYSTQTATANWTNTLLTPNTSYTYEVGVTDLAGNAATSSSVAITTDSLPSSGSGSTLARRMEIIQASNQREALISLYTRLLELLWEAVRLMQGR